MSDRWVRCKAKACNHNDGDGECLLADEAKGEGHITIDDAGKCVDFVVASNE
jgi:hypothetical protein